MPYNPDHDPFATATEGLMAVGKKGRLITPSDTEDIVPYPRSICCLQAGSISLIPVQNGDDEIVHLADVWSGWVCLWRVRRVMATGTTGVFATIEG